jgi:hypothetical protein
VTLGRDIPDLALEGEDVDEAQGKVPEQQADEEHALEELRVHAATDAAESSNDEYHGGRVEGKRKGRRYLPLCEILYIARSSPVKGAFYI